MELWTVSWVAFLLYNGCVTPSGDAVSEQIVFPVKWAPETWIFSSLNSYKLFSQTKAWLGQAVSQHSYLRICKPWNRSSHTIREASVALPGFMSAPSPPLQRMCQTAHVERDPPYIRGFLTGI